MARLDISLLGGFQVVLEGTPVATFHIDKARALLAYLAVEAGRSFRREVLASLLWPDSTETAARAGLRQALFQLRRVLGDHGSDENQEDAPFLLVTRTNICFNPAADCQVDVASFLTLSAGCKRHAGSPEDGCPACADLLAQAAVLYRGEFLAGFVSTHSAPFEDWRVVQQEKLHITAIVTLSWLTRHAERGFEYRQAMSWARWLTELEPWHEGAQRDITRLLALLGQREAALRQYHRLRDLLATELGTRPTRETEQLHRRIQDGLLAAETAGRTTMAPGPPPPFVSREAELASLDRFLDVALVGQGRVVFVAGMAGSGKTTLLEEFGRRAMLRHLELLVAMGRSSAHGGVGVPYLPFHEIAQVLDGGFPSVPVGGTQSDLFETITRRLHELARENPLLLLLDDLQWADDASVSLLFHLGWRLEGHRILIVGAYRPGPLALGRPVAGASDGAAGDKLHPLRPVVWEFQRRWGEIIVDLDRADGRRFVEQLLDAEPHRLSAGFSETLYRHTSGHALFAVELLHDLQARGGLIRDTAGRWIEGPSLNWDQLPARVEAVIAGRVDRLDSKSRALLDAACVEGPVFTAEVLAALLDTSPREVIAQLSGPLSRRHRLVRFQAMSQLGGRRVARYRFGHQLFRQYLYGQLDDAQRISLHGIVGRTLERFCAGDEESLDAVAEQLAWHFEEAGLPARAVLHVLRAGKRAVRLCAFDAALELSERGLGLLKKSTDQAGSHPDDRSQAGQHTVSETDFWLLTGGVQLIQHGWGAAERGHAIRQAVYASQLGSRADTEENSPAALAGLVEFHVTQAEIRQALALGQGHLAQAQRRGDPAALAHAHNALGTAYYFAGQPKLATEHFDRSLTYGVLAEPGSLQRATPLDLGVESLSLSVWAAWAMGNPADALTRSQQAMAQARASGHPVSVAFAYSFAVFGAYFLRREIDALRRPILEFVEFAEATEMPIFQAWATMLHGWLRAATGERDEGLAQLRGALVAWQHVVSPHTETLKLALLADACRLAEEPELGLEVVEDALALATGTEIRFLWACLLWLEGELRLAKEPDAAERAFRDAMTVARQQNALSWELRAAMSLYRLYARRKDPGIDEARRSLAEVYGRFTEGFDSPDLRDARALLEG